MADSPSLPHSEGPSPETTNSGSCCLFCGVSFVVVEVPGCWASPEALSSSIFGPCLLFVGGGGSRDWFFAVCVLFLLFLLVRFAASWAAGLAVSVWCLAIVVLTKPVRVVFSALVRLWWFVSSHIF